MPRVCCLNEVRVCDVYFVDKLAHGLQSYLAFQGVHLPEELRVSTGPRDVIMEHQLRTFGYVCDGQGWKNLAIIPSPPSDPIALDVPTEDQVPPPLAIVETAHHYHVMPDFGSSFKPDVGSSSFQLGPHPSACRWARAYSIEYMLRQLDLQHREML
ncbi:hypothetical protein Dimus_029095 [Dionaea muscipula]